MKNLNYHFIVPYLVLLIFCSVSFFLYGHEAATLWINNNHTHLGDLFFKYATYLGDGLMVVSIVLILLVIHRKLSIRIAIVGISLSIVSWVMKHVVFGKIPRPKKYFDPDIHLNFVEGVEMHGNYSFPSGHTMTAFTIAAFLAFQFKKPLWSIILLMLACIAGFSRIYLLQHFLIDVIAGSAIGILIALAWTRFFDHWDQKRLKQRG